MSIQVIAKGKSCIIGYNQSVGEICIEDRVIKMPVRFTPSTHCFQLFEDQMSGNLVFIFQNNVVKVYIVSTGSVYGVRKGTQGALSFAGTEYLYFTDGSIPRVWRRAHNEYQPMKLSPLGIVREMLAYDLFTTRVNANGVRIISTRDSEFELSGNLTRLIYCSSSSSLIVEESLIATSPQEYASVHKELVSQHAEVKDESMGRLAEVDLYGKPLYMDIHTAPEGSASMKVCLLSRISDEREKQLQAIQTDATSLFTKRAVNIIVGVDFGTSRTKVSYYSYATQKHVSLSFNDLPHRNSAQNYEDWTIPSVAAVNGERVLYGYEALSVQSSHLVSDMKRKVLEAKVVNEDLIICAGFIAYVFNVAREKIDKELMLGDNADYSFSICLPVTSMNNNVSVEIFRKMLSFTEWIYNEGLFHDLHGLMSLKESFLPTIELSFTDVIPESVAEIIEYFNDTPRKLVTKNALYALYDFGAGTTELTVFRNVKEQNLSDSKHILATEIVYEGFLDIILKCGSETPSDEMIKQHYTKIWVNFEKSGIWKILKENKVTGDESMAPFENIMIIASGGAAENTIIQEIFSKIPLYLNGDKINREVILLPSPRTWDSKLMGPYHRLAVSYGLTREPKQTLENYVLPKDSPAWVIKYNEKTQTEEELFHYNKKWNG